MDIVCEQDKHDMKFVLLMKGGSLLDIIHADCVSQIPTIGVFVKGWRFDYDIDVFIRNYTRLLLNYCSLAHSEHMIYACEYCFQYKSSHA